jgi:hypothetical protein
VGRRLRAHQKPQEAEVRLASNGGSVPVRPFPDGVLAGATSPRQVVEKALAAPRDVAPLVESGAVARLQLGGEVRRTPLP